ncbi:MAG TPA: hypothetical protein VGF95_11165 [Solirubrobacteraceae bacterium]
MLVSAMLLPATSAEADVGHKIITLCEEDKSLEGFSEKDYIRAMSEIEAYGVEYSECPEQIEEAELAAAGSKRHGGSKHGGSTSSPSTGGPGEGGSGPSSNAEGTSQPVVPTHEEQQQIEQARRGPTPVQLGSGPMGTIHPGVVHADVASAFNSLPTSLLVVLIALIAGVVALGGWAIRERVLSANHPG